MRPALPALPATPALLLTLLLPAALALSACAGSSGPVVGGPCSYDRLPGRCTVTRAEPGQPVGFRFEGGGASHDFDLEVAPPGAGPDAACLERLGLAAGKALDCTRMTITGGTCTPVVYEVGSLNAASCSAP